LGTKAYFFSRVRNPSIPGKYSRLDLNVELHNYIATPDLSIRGETKSGGRICSRNKVDTKKKKEKRSVQDHADCDYIYENILTIENINYYIARSSFRHLLYFMSLPYLK